MKAIVVYYSATGSTAKIAKAIYRGMKELMEVCDIVPLKKADPQNMARYDLIVIGGPIWYFRETANLREFIHKMPELSGKFCVPFCTHGCAPYGFMFSIAWALKKKGLTIIGWNDWYGGVSQVLHMPKPYFTDGHPDSIDMQEAEDFGREMVGRARRIAAGETDLIPKLPKGPDADSLWKVPKFVPPSEKPGQDQLEAAGPPPPPKPERQINLAKCTYPGCTTCLDNCPVNSISFSDNPPSFKDNCLNCALCDKLCPELAIEVDAETMKRRTQHRIDMKKCTYPQCTLCVDHCPMNSIDFSVSPPVFKANCEGDDLCWVICPQGAIEVTNLETTHKLLEMSRSMSSGHGFLKNLEEAEAKGKFRRLVPLDKVGWDNIIYKNQNPPRFVIDED